jgi:hypothetical protein
MTATILNNPSTPKKDPMVIFVKAIIERPSNVKKPNRMANEMLLVKKAR